MTEPKSEPTEAESQPAQGYTYVSHNFDSMNRAIDNQIQKQELMSVIYRAQRYETATRSILYVVATLCLLTLTAALLWWLLRVPPAAFESMTLMPKDQTALQTLSANESSGGTDASFIDTSFTVFHRNLTPGGDYVVTGKTYAPADLTFPIEQYCYLESANAQGELGAKPLASLEGTLFSTESDDPLLKKMAERYCRFTLATP